MADCQVRFVTRLTPSLEPDKGKPIAIGGLFSPLMAMFWVYYDRPLLQGPLDPTNWHVRYRRLRSSCDWINAHHDYVWGGTVNPIPDVPGKSVDYAADPADVKSLGGWPADALWQFPVD